MTNNIAESWIDTYDNYKDTINFVAGDYDSLKSAIRRYVATMNPENYNDWAESSEVGMFVNGLSYLGQSIHYRVDLNAHDIFPSTTERRQSLLNFAKMLSYAPKRNICANGIAKVTSISTTQLVKDTSGNNLKDVTINWNDSANKNWLEQFLTIMNSAFVSNNPFGKPLKKDSYNNITTQMYEFNSIQNNKTVFSFTAPINGSSQQFEIVNPDLDLDYNKIYERTPTPEQAFHILYRNDGTGNNSNDTGFFLYWKQGSLQSIFQQFQQKIENNFVNITEKNINEYDVWVQEVDSSSGLIKNNWTKIANNEYLVYNNTPSSERNIFKVETKDNDTIAIRFSDGKFGNIPVGLYRIWYRVSQGNSNLYIKPSDIKNISIRIPYKSNNTSDDNIYYLTIHFSVMDVSHIKQSVVQESLENIRERCPEVYSTQNRMVSGADYNKFPKSFGQQIKILKSVLRTYAGNSRFINFNDPSGMYQNLNVFADDGYIYSDDGLITTSEIFENYHNSEQIITNNIEPLLENLALSNYFYHKFPTTTLSYNKNNYERVKYIWNETFYSGKNTSYGTFLIEETEDEIPFEAFSKYIRIGSMIKFKNELETKEVWCSVTNITTFSKSTKTEYEIEINEVLDSNELWYADICYQPFITTLSSSNKIIINNLLDNFTSFGLRYNLDKSDWEVIETYKSLSNDDDEFIYSKNVNYEEGEVKDWLIKIEYNSSPNMWSFKSRYLDYIFGSNKDVSFFFNTDTKNNNNTFLTDDYIKLLKHQNNEEIVLPYECYWKPCDTIRYPDGYVDNKRFKIYGFDSDKDSTIDNPKLFDSISKNSNLFFQISENEYDTFLDNVFEVKNMWEHTTKSGIYYCQQPSTIYPAGTALPKSVLLTETVKLSNGNTIKASLNNKVVFEQGKIYPYDIVDIERDDNDNPIERNELIYWNSVTLEFKKYVEGQEYYIKKGIKNLSFLWKHFASSSYVINPSTTNIIDMFVLTNTYYNEVQSWLLNSKKTTFPKLPSAYELKSQFVELEKYSMATDTLVWHPVKYRLLFGKESDNELKATFRVIKNKTTPLSDNEIKQKVIQAIDEYFTTMEVGQKFYFTKLSTYIDNKLSAHIGSIVIVPYLSNDKFGNLFEIKCDEDEILLSSATIDDVQIIENITTYSINIGK